MPQIVSDLTRVTLDFFQNPATWQNAFLALLPILFYGYFFYKKTPRPRPKIIFAATFFVGCFSVVPLLFYQYLYQHYFPQIELGAVISNLAAQTILKGLMVYAFHLTMIAGLIFMLVFLITVITTLFAKKTFRNAFKSILDENFNFEFIALLVAFLVLAEIIVSQIRPFSIMQTVLGITILRAMLEEYSKHLIVRFTDDSDFFTIDDAIELSLFTGLAFAFVENILYFASVNNNFWTFFVGRSLLSVLAHIAFSGIFGYYYGMAHFASPLYFEQHTVQGKKSLFLIFLNKIFCLPQKNLYQELLILKGLFYATCLHTLFNFLLEYDLILFAFLVILSAIYFLLNLLKHKENYRQLGLIGTKVMPAADFCNLSWQIDSLRWAKTIKAKRKEKEKAGEKL